MSNFSYFLQIFALKIIKIYQKTLSFDHGFLKVFFPGGYCKFQPTCSNYAYQAVEKYGVFRGGFKALGRVFRCHPFNKGGYDPVK